MSQLRFRSTLVTVWKHKHRTICDAYCPPQQTIGNTNIEQDIIIHCRLVTKILEYKMIHLMSVQSILFHTPQIDNISFSVNKNRYLFPKN